MSLTLLKYNAQVLVEVTQNYEKLMDKRANARGEEAQKIDFQLKTMKSQILFLLTAIKKTEDKEKNA